MVLDSSASNAEPRKPRFIKEKFAELTVKMAIVRVVSSGAGFTKLLNLFLCGTQYSKSASKEVK